MNLKTRYRKLALLAVTAIVAASAAGCGIAGKSSGQTQQLSTPQTDALIPSTPDGSLTPSSPGALSGSNVQMLNADEGHLPVEQVDGKSYVNAQKLAELLEFQTAWNPATGRLSMGDNGEEFALTGGSNKATKEGNVLMLPDAPKVANGGLQIPLDALPDLFQEVISYEMRGGELVLRPVANTVDKSQISAPPEPEGKVDDLSFGDDPNDPHKNTPTNSSSSLLDEAVMAPSPEVIRNAIPVLKNVDTDKLVETANRYLGVKYLFGADPYPQSGKFDCSTFTQYVFGKYGISLPRTARAQARDGSSVSRKMLRKGDLMFYYVPGRFKSNKTIGHVGIYMGNNKMIHASPAPDNGVQISNINHEYWKKTFLQAKRFVD